MNISSDERQGAVWEAILRIHGKDGLLQHDILKEKEIEAQIMWRQGREGD
jgi:hypothetical protein